MEMTDKDIAKQYREAKNKNEQIKILADLNLCTPKEILHILTEAGEVSCVKPTMAAKAAPPKAPSYQLWTVEEIKELIRLIESGHSRKEAAEIMGIDYTRVQSKCNALIKQGTLFDRPTKDRMSKAVSKDKPASAADIPVAQPLPPKKEFFAPALITALAGVGVRIDSMSVLLTDSQGQSWQVQISKA